jgi:hypothetical protein
MKRTCNILSRDLFENVIPFKDILIKRALNSHRLQCKIEGEIEQVQIKILEIPTVYYFNLINSSK